MHRTKMPLRAWFWGAYLVAMHGQGISALQFQKQVGLSRYETAFNMLHKLRAGLVQDHAVDTKVEGTVEVDETFVGGRVSGPPGRGALGKTIVVGAVEVASGGRRPYSKGVRLRAISRAWGANLVRFIADRVASGSTVVTDDWSGYSRLREAGYGHVVAESMDDLIHIHRVFSNLKAWLKGTHRYVSGKHLQAYLNEFSFRFNRRKQGGVAFENLVGLASHRPAPTYRQLYAAGQRRLRGWIHPNVPHSLPA
jgi:transposase-like protein